MAKFLVLARSTGEAHKGRSPQEMQQIIQKYMAWAAGLRDAGRMLHAEKLRTGGRVVRGSGPRMVVTDGPFVESKEVLGGFWLIEAKSYEEVEGFLKDHPHLDTGSLEVREIEDLG